MSDTTFSQLTADGKWIRSVGRRQRLLLRGSLGAMAVDDFDQLPPELRFFAGGDRSMRGFDYQELGATNAAGKVIGGEFLAVGSAEYEKFFSPKWGGAVFVDAGDAFRTSEFDLNVGAGIGVRWRSPVGMVRFDFAKPVVSDLADSIRFHITHRAGPVKPLKWGLVGLAASAARDRRGPLVAIQFAIRRAVGRECGREPARRQAHDRRSQRHDCGAARSRAACVITIPKPGWTFGSSTPVWMLRSASSLPGARISKTQLRAM